MTSALETALLKRNRQAIVDYLVNNGALIQGYWVNENTQFTPNTGEMNSEALQANCRRWIRLVRETVPCSIASKLRLDGDTEQFKNDFQQVSATVRLHVTIALANADALLMLAVVWTGHKERDDKDGPWFQLRDVKN